MRLSIYLFFFIGIVFSSCRKDKIAKDTPKCIKEWVKEQRKNLCAHEGSSIIEYSFQGETVYRLDIAQGCIWPGAYVIYDADCNALAQRSGAPSSPMQEEIVNGEDFSNAIFVRQIWEKQ